MKGKHYQPNMFDRIDPADGNRLFYGDNLTIMDRLKSESVDLIYLDPPFNSNRNYNLIYKQLTGQPVPEQEVAFCDAWELDSEKVAMADNIHILMQNKDVDQEVIQFWSVWVQALKHTQPRLLAYLIYMSSRLVEMRRILKPTGSIYLHCDPTASHYIKIFMDGIFGHAHFRNEIIWQRSSAHNDAKQGARQPGRIHDVILFYTRDRDQWTWNPQFTPYSTDYIDSDYSNVDPDGRRYKTTDLTAAKKGGDTSYEWKGVKPSEGRYWAYSRANMERFEEEGRLYYTRNGMPRLKQYLDEMPGIHLQDIWTDIPPISSQAKERLGYPTQKPVNLLKRIIEASSNPGDVIFDPFCGCGTAIYAAHELGRKWVGCDIAILSVQIVRDVLVKRYGLQGGIHYIVDGVPLSAEGAQDLFDRDPRQFQHWVVELAGGFSNNKHSGDTGIDGRIYYETQSGLKSMVLSVKGGKNLSPHQVRELRGVLERESNTEMAGFICSGEPTKGMLSEAAQAGMYEYQGVDYERLQIRTVQELLDGYGFDTPSKVQTLNWVKQLPLPL